MKTIAIATQKGGVGKTTSTFELSSIFSKDNKVLIIDLDPQRDLSKYSGADISENAYTILDILDPDERTPIALNKIIQTVRTTETGRLDIIISSEKLVDDAKLFPDIDDIFLLQDFINALKSKSDYDYVFIDNAPGRSIALYMSYIASDYIISPAGPCEASIDGILKVATDLRAYNKRGFSNAKLLGYFMYCYEKTTAHAVALDTFSDMGEAIGYEPFKTVIPKSIAVTECKSARCSINEYDKKNKVSEAYRKLASEIKERIANDEQ